MPHPSFDWQLVRRFRSTIATWAIGCFLWHWGITALFRGTPAEWQPEDIYSGVFLAFGIWLLLAIPGAISLVAADRSNGWPYQARRGLAILNAGVGTGLLFSAAFFPLPAIMLALGYLWAAWRCMKAQMIE